MDASSSTAQSPTGHDLQPQRWRVHETGRVLHLLVDELASCGEPGTRWRTVAGMARCPACRSAARDAA